MSNVKKYTDKLDKLNFENMYNGDFFLTWEKTDDEIAAVFTVADAHKALFGEERIGSPTAMDKRRRPLIDKWTFSTNGVSIQGRYGIPCVGFGPGAESQAHAPNEITRKSDLVRCAAVYALTPFFYKGKGDEDVCEYRAGGTGNDIR